MAGPIREIAPLVTAHELIERDSAHAAGWRIVDARWYLSGKRGKDEYDAGHLPGAAFVNLDRDLSAPSAAGPGRHPLPSAEAFADLLGRLGITATTRVVAYDDAGGAIAARLWWLLRHFGLRNGAVLDGGISAWTQAGGELTTEVPAIVPAAPLKLVARTDDVADKRAVDRLRVAPGVLLLDARALERFEGKSEPIDARAGHIPGARSMPFVGNLVAPGGRFLDRASLAKRYDEAGARSAEKVVCYCGSGVTACHDLLALALIGRDDAVLYEGSWSDWAADADLPAAVGSG
jgi:thiosulfate/3-mercaptopyruvate sulfurtransferase